MVGLRLQEDPDGAVVVDARSRLSEARLCGNRSEKAQLVNPVPSNRRWVFTGRIRHNQRGEAHGAE
jgi:hypothetical protein